MENYFSKFRNHIVGINHTFKGGFGEKKLLYADWTASGRLYKPIEDILVHKFGPFVANTHTESNQTGTIMTNSYQIAQSIIKNHVNANETDVIIMDGSGMTSAINKFQRILGLRIPEWCINKIQIPEKKRPVVFISHMEHHSNHVSWLETICDVVIIEPDEMGNISILDLEKKLKKYSEREWKYGSFTACSNVTGIVTPYHKIAKMMHTYGGYCFIDFSASAPYVDINMHPRLENEHLDAIFFSPHKLLGGPGSSGVLIFSSSLYNRTIPDHPGGGTVKWTNPWGEKAYVDSIEEKEDGGTPGFLQAIRAALAIKLKETMGVMNILKREKELTTMLMNLLKEIPNINILEADKLDRIGIISFYCEHIHYSLFVKLLNDQFGIQTRGGCSCAGTYGHYLLSIDQEQSKKITNKIDSGFLEAKPGWVRISLHPTMTNEEIEFIGHAVKEIVKQGHIWTNEYKYNETKNEYEHNLNPSVNVDNWFEF